MRWAKSLGIGLVLVLVGCEADNWGPEELFLGKSAADIRLLREGRRTYATYCVGCHGEQGKGDGPAARFMDPKPRDFTRGVLKFAAVASGELPRDEDYHRIIRHGLKGTAMPAFPLLSSDELDGLVAYIRAFNTESAGEAPGGVITPGQDPWADDPEAGIEEGRRIYHSLAKCWSCHPAYVSKNEIVRMNEEMGMGAPPLRPDLYETTIKDSNWGVPIRAPDFLVDYIKTGNSVENIARVVAAGVGGTAMPTWGESLDPEQLWGLGYYVNSLARIRGTEKAKRMKEELLGEERGEVR